VHGFLFNRGEKMSKSVGNVISPTTLAEHYGVDPLRYFFLREVPFGQDGNYSHEAIVARITADLANDLGNLAQRSLSIVARNGAAVPAIDENRLAEADREMLATTDALLGLARVHMRVFHFHLYIGAVMDAVGAANRYFANAEPWKLAKTDPERMAAVLYVTLETLRVAAILLQPVMPSAMARLLDLLAVAPENRGFADLATRLTSGGPLPAPAPVFPRYVEEPA
jgi:methionyl-tRNA synthetase